jgi:hypothetical protein
MTINGKKSLQLVVTPDVVIPAKAGIQRRLPKATGSPLSLKQAAGMTSHCRAVRALRY